MSLAQLIPDADLVLQLPSEELAFYVLQAAQQASSTGRMNIQVPYNEVTGTGGRTPAYPPAARGKIEVAIAEAWQWLENQLLIVPEPGVNGKNGYRLLGRRAGGLRTAEQFKAFRQALAFPKELLHPLIAERTWIALMRGEFDSAVFFAFRTVEEQVRAAGSFAMTDVGVDLMRKAFNPSNGPLRRDSDPIAEKEALMHLFAGAIGSYKNPHSHRTVTIQEAGEAQEIVVLASHLLRIVDSRRPKP